MVIPIHSNKQWPISATANLQQQIHRNINMKHFTQILLALLLYVLPGLTHAELKPLDQIVVVVNDDVITQTMLDNRIEDFRKQLELSQLSRIEPDTLKKQVLERMIRDTIQLQQAKQFGITVDDLMLNRMLEQLAKGNKMTLDTFRITIEAEGLNYARFREQTRDELIINQLQQRVVASKINVSDQEVQQYIEQNETSDSSNITFHLRHILIATPETASPEDIDKAKQEADSVYKKITHGAKFEDMAIKYSSGRNALKGGDLGKRKANELPQLFVDAIKSLSAGETSKPIKSASGFHLLQLVSGSNDTIMVQQTNARHILIRASSEVSDDQARKKLLQLKQQIESGKSFAELASECLGRENLPPHLKVSPKIWTSDRYQNLLKRLLAGTYLKFWSAVNTTREKPTRKIRHVTQSKNEKSMKNSASGYAVSVTKHMSNSSKKTAD